MQFVWVSEQAFSDSNNFTFCIVHFLHRTENYTKFVASRNQYSGFHSFVQFYTVRSAIMWTCGHALILEAFVGCLVCCHSVCLVHLAMKNSSIMFLLLQSDSTILLIIVVGLM